MTVSTPFQHLEAGIKEEYKNEDQLLNFIVM